MLVLYEQFSCVLLGYMSVVFNYFHMDFLPTKSASLQQILTYGENTLHLYREALWHVSDRFAGQIDMPEIQISNTDVFSRILDIIVTALPYNNGLLPTDDLEYLVEYLLDSCTGANANDYFATPAVLAEFILDVLNPPAQSSIFDPSCGSGAFLLAAGRRRGPLAQRVEGSERNNQWKRIAQLNLLFHNQQTAIHGWDDIEIADMNRKFDYVITNPPFSNERIDMQMAYEYNKSLAVSTNNRYRAFIQIILKMLRGGGKGAIVVPDSFLLGISHETVLIHRWLLENFLLEGIINLPANVFYPRSSVNASIIILTRISERELLQNQTVAMLNGRRASRNKRLEPSDFTEIMSLWRDRDSLRKEWARQIQAESKTNLHGAAAPTNWPHEDIWFANAHDIQQLDYVLLPNRYQPSDTFQMSREAPQDILREVLDIERQITETLEEELLRNVW